MQNAMCASVEMFSFRSFVFLLLVILHRVHAGEKEELEEGNRSWRTRTGRHSFTTVQAMQSRSGSWCFLRQLAAQSWEMALG
jgi:hypothetical protein